jgi:3-hydroxyisobutyrate dehydrogenase-like beta-hydroxyacid dehydrogenase
MVGMSARTLPSRPVIGVLHPGAMGSAVGAALKRSASGVIWAAAGRSITTSKRAELADLIGVPDLAELARRAHVIISVCPPDAAVAVAEEVAAALGDRADRPLYVDANAVAPATVQRIADLLGEQHVVDGSIIGPPAYEPGSTVVWLSGAAAPAVAALFAGSPFTARVLDDRIGTASALKACFALQSKAQTALRLAMASAAQAYGVTDALREELDRAGGAPLLDAPSRQVSGKAWRWVGEMREAAAALSAVGVPDGFSLAAAEVYERLAAADETDRANIWGLRG